MSGTSCRRSAKKDMKHSTALHRGWASLDQDGGPLPEWPPPHLTMASRKGVGEAALGNLIGRSTLSSAQRPIRGGA
ncbi:uncharacterized protein VDAG_04602 [Verticillium dahliae VdLs.17]|uniref:Uncharacterized protein n=1 Tax=Verticillium dahliae (strain VdLs.17 / ATCC MYA-4575 / FGSC 10137) TaxID=498257 RepID=G2X3L5_VERDV|nr:uncharacterized protein VDAG_04602 [Verticillium dahliae VdLs.17]EGY23164.1 hypothetical protein VDAG_04602 [Verticillium dahliae VdLs.17]KAH6682444.1 hypothetical protein EV126DRAFT_446765 [Verticillium dahliae]KAH6689298.1 hypothetical protein EV126DRAFT_445565 [Verticillium dahliae]